MRFIIIAGWMHYASGEACSPAVVAPATCPQNCYGTENTGTGPCDACPMGKWQDSGGLQTCKSCPAGESTHADQLCHDDTAAAVTSCYDQACVTSKGNLSPSVAVALNPPTGLPTPQNCKCSLSCASQGGAAHFCEACAAGKYSPAGSPCIDCPVGKKGPPETGQTADTVCTACPAGTTFAAAGSTACSPVRNCTVGQGQSTAPTPGTDRACAACVAGTNFSAVDSGAVCQPVSTACAAGFASTAATASVDLTCTACATGKFKAGTSSTTAKEDCADWSMCGIGSGKSADGSATADRQCTACVAGTTFSTGNDAAACAPTSAACAPGSYTKTAATASNNLECDTCAVGKIKVATSSPTVVDTCADCPTGRANNVVGSSTDAACVACAANTWQDETGKATCKDATTCAAGKAELTAPTTVTDRACCTIVNCVLSNYSAWGSCSDEDTNSTCHENRTRTVTTAASCTGTACASGRMEIRLCSCPTSRDTLALGLGVGAAALLVVAGGIFYMRRRRRQNRERGHPVGHDASTETSSRLAATHVETDASLIF